MPDVVFSELTGSYWLLAGLAAFVGITAGWLTVLLLVHPVRATGIPGLMPLQGVVSAHGQTLAAFAVTHVLADLPSPRRFFESLGPDRFRREFGRALKTHLDAHVDDVMTRRNESSWVALSAYARNRVYTHVHRRLPYVVDDFVDHVQRDLDDIVHPAQLVRRYFDVRPEQSAQIFLETFGADLRAVLPLAALAGLLVALPAVAFIDAGWQFMAMFALAALAGSAITLLALTWPVLPSGIWPVRMQGILHRRRQRFGLALANRLANDALGWHAVIADFLRGAQAGRVRYMMRREVAAILDVPLFRTSMQLLLGPGGFAEVKSSAVEKAVEVLADTPVSAALREHYRAELARTLEHAAARIPPADYQALWQHMLALAWRRLPGMLAVAGAAVGWIVHWLMLNV